MPEDQQVRLALRNRGIEEAGIHMVGWTRAVAVVCVVLNLALVGRGSDLAPDITRIEVIPLDPDATHYGTFQSHNQKVAWSPEGIFTTHIRRRNAEYTAQEWRLSRSLDGGQTFHTLHEGVHPTQPSPIEIDAAGTLHLLRVDFLDGNAYHHRFPLRQERVEPQISAVPGAAAGKHTLLLDEQRGQLYFFSHNNTFHILGLDGTVRQSKTLLRDGPHALLQYPHLALASDGTLIAAWTTQKHGAYLYWDIHAIRSPDGGDTWTTLAGEPLAIPIVADDTGPADQISTPEEFDVHTWLANVLVAGDKIHFLHESHTEPRRQHYLRYDLATGQRDLHHTPRVGGESLKQNSLDGFFATDGKRLFLVGSDGNRIIALRSDDWGATWSDHAVSEPLAHPIYAVGGNRRVTGDGFVIGTFTEMTRPSLDETSRGAVHFFRFPANP